MEELFIFYLILFLLCHFIGDYYLQTEKMAREKGRNFQKMLIHCILYAVPFAALFLVSLFYELNPFFDTFRFGLFILIIIVSHFIIDVGKDQIEFSLKQKMDNNDGRTNIERIIYIADQFCHIGILAAFSLLLAAGSPSSSSSPAVSENIFFGLKVALFTLIILRPTNITFKKIFSKYQPQKPSEISENESITGTGSIIGTLERLLMGIFIGIGQFAAVGLIMTAKSLARYDRISKDPQFAEYYLIGTLYSVLVTLVVYILLFNISV